MSDLVLLEKQKDGSVREHAISGALKLPVDPGAAYSIIDKDTSHEPTDLVVKHEGHDLQVLQGDHLIADIENFYGQGSDASFSVETPAGEMLTFQSGDPATVIADDGIVWQAESTVAGADPSSGVPGWVAPALVGAIGVGGVIGGGENSGVIAAPAAAASQSTLNLSAYAGEFISTVQVNVYASNGNLLSSTQENFSNGQVAVSFDGSYTGPVIVQISDINGTAPDYYDETTGTDKSLGSAPLRAMVDVSAAGTMNVTVSPLTELATEMAGVGSNNAVTSTDLAENAHVAALFGLGDILGPVTTVDNSSYSASTSTTDPAEQYGNVLAMLSGADNVTGSTAATLAQLSTLITTNPDGSLSLTSAGSALLSQGVEAFQAGPNGGTVDLTTTLANSLNIITTPTETLSGIHLSADSGVSATDFITNVPAQTVTATLSSPLVSGETLMASLDGGTTFTDITGSVGTGTQNTTVSWSTTLLAGTNTIEFQVVNTMGNTGPTTTQTYTLDTTAPTTTVSGLTLSNDTGVSASDFITNTPAQTITATLSAPLAAGEILLGSLDGGTTFTDITANVGTGTASKTVSWSTTLAGASGTTSTGTIELVVEDTAGNMGTAASQAYTVDMNPPTTTVSGIALSNDTGASATDFLTDAPGQTIMATLSAALAPGDVLLGSVDGGTTFTDITSSVSGTSVAWSTTLSGATGTTSTNTIEFKVQDAAGNAAPTSTQTYTLDTNPPTITGIAVDAAGQIQLTMNTDVSASTFEGGDFTVMVNGNPYTIASATATGTIVTLSGASGYIYQGDVVNSVAYNAAAGTPNSIQDTAGNALATATSTSTISNASIGLNESTSVAYGTMMIPGVLQDGGSGNDLLSAHIHTSTTSVLGLTGLHIDQAGHGGNDALSLQLNNTAASSTTFVHGWISDNAIFQDGGTGSDTLAAVVSAVGGSASNAQADVSGNEIVQDGGAGNDAMSVSIDANVAFASSKANAKVGTNHVDLNGGTGSDTISVDLAARLLTAPTASRPTPVTTYTTGSRHAQVGYDTVYVDGAAGNDAISVNVTASAAATYGTAVVSHNQFDVAGGAGTDSLQLDIAASVAGTRQTFLQSTRPRYSNAYYSYGKAKITGNDAYMNGGSGNDLLSVSMRAASSAPHALAFITRNDVLLAGGSGSDAMSAVLSASASGSRNAWAYAEANHVQLLGGAGNDGIATGSPILVDLTVHAMATGPAYQSDYLKQTINSLHTRLIWIPTVTTLTPAAHASARYNAIGFVGATGNDAISVDLGAGAIGASHATAKDTYNHIHLDGGSGTDSLSVNLNANASGTSAAARATANVKGNLVWLDGGSGNDSLMVSMSAAATAAGQHAAGIHNNVALLAGGAGNDTLALNASANQVVSNAFDVFGGSGNDSVAVHVGGFGSIAQNDIHVLGGAGSDTLSLDIGNPTAVGAVGSNHAAIFGGAGADNISAVFTASTSSANTLVVRGGAGADTIHVAPLPGEQVMLQYAGANEFGDSISGLGAGNNVSVVFASVPSLTTGSFTYNATAFDLVHHAAGGGSAVVAHFTQNVGLTASDIHFTKAMGSSISMSTPSLGTSNIVQEGGSGPDTLSLRLTGVSVTGLFMAQDGSGGNDTLALDVQATSRISANDIYLNGGPGQDMIAATLQATGAVPSHRYASVTGNNLVIDAGTGGGSASVNLDARVSGSAWKIALPSLYSNDIAVYGGAGADALNVNLNATAMAYYEARADILGEHVALEGGGGSDSLAVAIGVSAMVTGSTAGLFVNAGLYTNTMTLTGGSGNDVLSVAINAHAAATPSDTVRSATASVDTQHVVISGGQGTDTVNVAMRATASQATVRATGYVSYNAVSVDAGAGNDSVAVTMQAKGGSATASAPSFGLAELYLNNIYVSASSGNDAVAVNLFATAAGHQSSAGAEEISNSVQLDGGAGNDAMQVDMRALWSVIHGTTGNSRSIRPASISANQVTLAGSGGSDTLAATMSAQGFGQRADAFLFSNTIGLSGGSGNDTLTAALRGTAHPTASVIGNDYVGIGSNAMLLDGGTGNDVMNADIVAHQSGKSGSASIYSNSINVYGGDGQDSIAVAISASASAQALALPTKYFQAYASMYGNAVGIDGGSGNDSVSARLHVFGGGTFTTKTSGSATVTQHQSRVTATLDHNSVLVAGGSGSDAIALNLSATGSAEHSALVHNDANRIGLYGSQGSDSLAVNMQVHALETGTMPSTSASSNASASETANVLRLEGGTGNDALMVTMSATAQGHHSALAKVVGNTVSLSGGAGSDSLSLTMKASATASTTAIAHVDTNQITVSGGSGSDMISVSLSAVAHAAATTGTPVASGSVNSNVVNIVGGAGVDTISVNFAASNAISGNTVAINGGAGADIIQINQSAGTTSAGNSFVFVYSNTTELSAANGDSISGLNAGDSVKFNFNATNFTHNTTASGHLAPSMLHMVSSTAGMATMTGDFWIYDTGNHSLYYAKSGHGSSALLVAQLTSNVTTLAASDIAFHTGTMA